MTIAREFRHPSTCRSAGIQRIRTPIKLSVGAIDRDIGARQGNSDGIQTLVNLSVGAIGQDIGSRSRDAFRDRAHRDDRRVCVIT